MRQPDTKHQSDIDEGESKYTVTHHEQSLDTGLIMHSTCSPSIDLFCNWQPAAAQHTPGCAQHDDCLTLTLSCTNRLIFIVTALNHLSHCLQTQDHPSTCSWRVQLECTVPPFYPHASNEESTPCASLQNRPRFPMHLSTRTFPCNTP